MSTEPKLNTKDLTILNKKVKISAIITAGGTSARFGKNKLLEKLGNSTVIETTIEKFLDLADEIVIPAGEETKNFLLNSPYVNRIKFAPPGKTRQKSVYSALCSCSNPEIVLIHDGARPFIEKEIIEKSIELAKKEKAVVVGTMAIDTIKKVADGRITETLDRRLIFQAQTPQVFDFELIKKIHENFKDDPNFTDDSSMAEKFGIRPVILEGSKNNKKITTKEDLINIS